MREIKFQFLYKGLPFHGGTDDCNWFKKVYTLDQLIEKPLSQLSDVHCQSTLIAKRQFTGLKDKNGVDIYEGDILECNHLNKWVALFDDRGCFVASDPECAESWVMLDDWDFEIIGNIHQNSDLLESK